MEPITTTLDEFGDKSLWGDGPWVGEPDRVLFEVEGFPALARRGPAGAWCGYVGVSPGHPWFEQWYDDVDAEVHGGLTYARHCDDHPLDGICHVSEEGDHVWWLGFDCSHMSDVAPGLNYRLRQASESQGKEYDDLDAMSPWPVTYKDLAYVTNEITNLALQAAAATNKENQ